jgi:FkbM family methyltransferase
MNFITRKIDRIKAKKTLHEYGCDINTFNIPPFGSYEYAQWLHPLEQKKYITAEMISFFKQFIGNGDFVIDIGAHTGDTTVPIAICSGKDGMVIALEPNPFVYKILQKNANLNKETTCIVPLNFAATDSDGNFTFNYSDASYCNGGFFQKIENQKHGHKYTLEVTGKNLEKYLLSNYIDYLPKLSLIKVDAEGYDKEILKSISSLIKKYRPVIISECNKNLTQHERFELFDILNLIGYKLKMTPDFESMTYNPIEKKEDMLLWKHFDFIALPD